MTTAALGTFSALNEELSRAEERALGAERRAAMLQDEVDSLTVKLQKVILERKHVAEQKQPQPPSTPAGGGSSLLGSFSPWSTGAKNRGGTGKMQTPSK